MNLFILDKNPVSSANRLVEIMGDKYAFKMLIELGQLVCSAGISNVYKKIPQGKKIQEWVKENPYYVWAYMKTLFHLLHDSSIKIKKQNKWKICQIIFDILENTEIRTFRTDTAYFRYAKEYECDIPNDTLLSIEKCITETEKYLKWKKSNINDGSLE